MDSEMDPENDVMGEIARENGDNEEEGSEGGGQDNLGNLLEHLKLIGLWVLWRLYEQLKRDLLDWLSKQLEEARKDMSG